MWSSVPIIKMSQICENVLGELQLPIDMFKDIYFRQNPEEMPWRYAYEM